MSYGSKHPGVPVSLVQPGAATAAERKAVANLKAANGAPAADAAGFHTQGKRFLHIVVQLPDAGTSVEWSLWTWDAASGLWCLDTRPGTAGTVALAVADSPQRSIVEIDGLERVYLQFKTFAGAFTTGLNAWLATSGEVDGG